ncbi:Transcription factor MYC4, partial [Mucuna pruriens]
MGSSKPTRKAQMYSYPSIVKTDSQLLVKPAYKRKEERGMSEVNDEILHEHLKNLIEGSPIRWTYAILWRCYTSPKLSLRFREGYHRGTGTVKEVRILGSCVSAAEEVTDAESEWFFKISKGQTFAFHEDLLGHAFLSYDPVWITAADTDDSSWKRVTWGHQFGIQTFLCLPLREAGVLELASTEIIPRNLEAIEDMVDFIRPIGTPRHLAKLFR